MKIFYENIKMPNKDKEIIEKINFDIIDGEFNYSNNKITLLKNCPKKVNGDFILYLNKLENLKYRPKYIHNNFDVSHNKINNLKGAPEYVGKDFIIHNNKLENLEYSPKKIGGNFNCSYNNLTSLKGCSNEIGEEFFCENNPNLKNVKRQIIQHQIKAIKYYTDEGDFSFEEIEKEFNIYKLKLYNIEKNKKKNLILKNKQKINNKDYGLSI